MSSPALDLTRFAKIRDLHDRAATTGEREAAAGRMKSLADKAGMTVTEAVSKLDAPTPQTRAEAMAAAFNDLFNTPEARAERTERERRRAERRVVLLAEYGSEDAVWEPCERERALEAACRPVIVRKPIINGEMDTLEGWDGGRWARLSPNAQEAVASAYKAPATVRETLVEWRYWEKRGDDQYAFWADASAVVWVRARIEYLEHRLDTLPAESLNDLRARLEWMRILNEREWHRDAVEDRMLLDQLTDDVEQMGALIREQDGAPVQNGHRERTRAERRRDVLDLLGQGLADREIARRAGVSPQTVGNLRRAHEARTSRPSGSS